MRKRAETRSDDALLGPVDVVPPAEHAGELPDAWSRFGQRTASAIRDPIVAYRIGLTLVLACYLIGIIGTGFVPLSPALDVPFGVTGWLLFAFPMVWSLLRRRTYRTTDLIGRLLRPPLLAGVFGVLIVVSSYFALAWQLPPACHGISANCFKGYEWGTQSGQFYHVTVEGIRTQISLATYISEVGVHLRSAAAFGIYSLCFAWAAAITLERDPSQRSANDAGRAERI